ncbi:alpha/beta hydrolase [Aeromicrobium sp. CF4.19]|uniref:alpha/beta hydrolase n=1 Tax=Aeromicrobium sp. CF4.19 TaxID=3373082 RepID=UPI003EE6B62C
MRTQHRYRNAHRRLARGVIAAITGALLLAACTSASQESEDNAEIGGYLEQSLDWDTCEDTATNSVDAELFADPALECASVEVPIDYDEPDGDRAQIALLRIPASGEAQGSLLINPGGPGGAGTSFVAANLPLWQDSPVLESFDIVGFDPRGIGGSTPALDCYTDEEYDAGNGLRFGAVNEIADAEQATEFTERCIDGSGGVENVVNAGSTNVVRDMDLMREVLGDEKLTFLGYSYGSELGAMYTETYPENVRAVVLDGAVSPDMTPTELRAAQYAVLQDRFDELAALCAESPECVLGLDPTAVNDRLHDIVEPLVDSPAQSTDGREVSIWDVYNGINAGLFSEANWPTIISALSELKEGNPDEILALRDSFYSRTADGVHTIDLDTNTIVRCMDWPRLTPQERTDSARELGEIAPMFDLEALTGGQYHHECEAWPAPPTRDEPWLEGGTDLPETLIVSVTGDPGTPHEGGIALAEALGGSLLTVEGKQHGAYLVGGNECVDRVVSDYLLQLETPPAGSRCSL